MKDYQVVLKFWFEELTPEDWFKKDPQLDQTIQKRFLKILELCVSGELASWRQTPQGTLAQILVLDQFPRNIFREDPRAFAQDPLALAIAQDAIAKKMDLELSIPERKFFYMPFMHSESATIHQEAVRLFSEPGFEENLKFEILHKNIIDRFGRYPHRNKVLGRKSTPEELAFLKEDNSSF